MVLKCVIQKSVCSSDVVLKRVIQKSVCSSDVVLKRVIQKKSVCLSRCGVMPLTGRLKKGLKRRKKKKSNFRVVQFGGLVQATFIKGTRPQ